MNTQSITVTLNIQDYNFLKEQSDKYRLLLEDVEQKLSAKNVVYVERDSYGNIKNLKLQEGYEPILELSDVKKYVNELSSSVDYFKKEYAKENETRLKVDKLLEDYKLSNKDLHSLIEKYKKFAHDVRDKLYRLGFLARLDFLLFPEQNIGELCEENKLWRYDIS